MDSGVVRRPSFLHEDDGLPSFADIEPGFSGTLHDHGDNSANPRKCHSMRVCSARGGFRTRCPMSPRSGYEEGPLPHFLAACFLCKKQLGNNRDIFMYRGDTAFCSEECRQEQIYMEESKEKDLDLSRKKQQQPTSPSRDYNNNNSKNAFHAGAVAAA
ncbi:hypothetical protein MLD38_038942 [Melastoma candidum]|uniref:Uncharacterized protein n=1 Tax=Melastoma candidum TaxID=119954 RepID=A0ACB9L1P0_9MYRT|nr:hypothetical protein MLD38_038942 [Melastoma candidum]